VGSQSLLHNRGRALPPSKLAPSAFMLLGVHAPKLPRLSPCTTSLSGYLRPAKLKLLPQICNVDFGCFVRHLSSGLSPLAWPRYPLSFRNSLWVWTMLRSSGEIGGPCPRRPLWVACGRSPRPQNQLPGGGRSMTDSLTHRLWPVRPSKVERCCCLHRSRSICLCCACAVLSERSLCARLLGSGQVG
jgi:hypothetical protein